MKIEKGAHVRVHRHPVGDPPKRQAAIDGILTEPYAAEDTGMHNGVKVTVDGEERFIYSDLARVEVREGEPRRDWMKIAQEGGSLFDQRERIELAITQLEWQEHPLPKTLPMSPGLAIKGAIEEYRIPKVSAVAIHGADLIVPDDGENGGRAFLGLYGVEGNYRNGRVRLYLIDYGSHLNAVAADVYEPIEA